MTNGELKQLLTKYPDDVLVFVESDKGGLYDFRVVIDRAHVAADGTTANPKYWTPQTMQTQYEEVIALQEMPWPWDGQTARTAPRARARHPR